MNTNFFLFFWCLLVFEEIDSSEVLDGLETNTGLGDLKYCYRMIKESIKLEMGNGRAQIHAIAPSI